MYQTDLQFALNFASWFFFLHIHTGNSQEENCPILFPKYALLYWKYKMLYKHLVLKIIMIALKWEDSELDHLKQKEMPN